MAYKEWIVNSYITYNAYISGRSDELPEAGYPDDDAYLAIRNQAVGDYITINPTINPWLIAGQSNTHLGSAETYRYYVRRGVFFFRNSGSIMASAPIEYAKLEVYKLALTGEINFTIVITNGQPTYPHAPPVVEDFDITHYSGNGGQLVNPTGYGWEEIVLNEDGRGFIDINVDYIAKLCLVTQDDIDSIAPLSQYDDGFQYIKISRGTRAKLTIRVTLSIPTGQTDAATLVDATSATFNGEATDSGYWMDSYGFEWKEGEEGEVSSVTVGTNKTQGLVFSYPKTGIPGVIYYRAWAENGAGKGYGDWVLVRAGVVNIGAMNSSVFARTILTGEIMELGATVVERGFEYKIQDEEPGAGDTGTEVKELGAGFAAEEYSLRNQELYEQVEDTVWWFRAYCKDDGANKFMAASWMKNLPTVTTQAISSINYNKADGNGNISSKGASDLTNRGFEVKHEYSGSFRNSWKFDIAGFEGELEALSSENAAGVIIEFYWAGDLIKTVLEIVGLELGAFLITIGQMEFGWPVADDCLIEGKSYTCRAFASNEFGTVYGEEVSFNTWARTFLAEDFEETVGETTVVENELIENLPGGVIASRRGFRYGTTEAADEFDIHENGSFTNGSYSVMLPDLLPETTYYVVAYIVVNGITYEGDLKTKTTSAEGEEDSDEYPTPHFSPHGQDYREIETKVFAEVLASQGIIDFSGGKKTLPITNHLIQANPNAKSIADNYLNRFKLAKTRMTVTFPTPLPFEREDTVDFSYGDVLFKENDEGVIHFKEDGAGASLLLDQISMIIKKINSVGLTKTPTSINYTAVLDLEHE